MKGSENFRSQKGSCVHKALECLAWRKKLEQDGLTEWNDDNFGITNISECEPDLLIRRSFDYYASEFPQFNWAKKDFEDCKQWMWNVLNISNGYYDPRKLKIVMPEQSFDFELPYDWAHYKYELAGNIVLEGQLSIKGTMDLVSEIRPKILHITDYKTGERMDWGTGKEKTYEKLSTDSQLRIYSYAAMKLFPNVKDILITIIYARDGNFKGGPFTVLLSKDDLPETERILEAKFNEIKECQVPYLTPHPYWSGLPSKGQKILPCQTFCHFGKTKWPDSKQNICQYIHNHIKKYGIEETTNKFGDLSKIQRYGSHSGRQIKESE